MNLPNSLSVMRIFLVPLLVVVLLTQFEGRMIFGVPKEIVGAAIFGLASLTDWADGYLARRRKQITPFGQLIDPLADKLLILAALFSLVQMELVDAWMATVIIGREFAVTVFRSIAYARGVVIPASPLGKIKMVAEVVAILALILGHEQLREFVVIGKVGLWVVLVAALVSAADYFRRFNLLLSPRVADFAVRREQRARPQGRLEHVVDAPSGQSPSPARLQLRRQAGFDLDDPLARLDQVLALLEFLHQPFVVGERLRLLLDLHVTTRRGGSRPHPARCIPGRPSAPS